MAFHRKSRRITKDPKSYAVTYLGYLPLENDNEAKKTRANIDAIVKDTNTKERDLKKINVKVTDRGLILLDPKNKTERAFVAEKIYRCSAERGVGEEPVFSFVYDKQGDESPRFEFHAVLCTGKDTATEIANSLQASFKHTKLLAARNLREQR